MITFLTIKDICEQYGLKRDYVYELLKIEGAPVLPRKSNAPYLVIEDEFDEFIRKVAKQ